MPYIKQEQRKYIDSYVTILSDNILNLLEDENDSQLRAGLMNYVITKLILNVYGKDLRYDQHNSIVGFLECCKQEFYRRATSALENKKINENGDVY